MDYDVGEDLEANVLGAAVECCNVHCSADERGVKYITPGEEGVDPHTAQGFRHDVSGVFDSGMFGMFGGLFEFADIFAIGGVVGHSTTTILAVCVWVISHITVLAPSGTSGPEMVR